MTRIVPVRAMSNVIAFPVRGPEHRVKIRLIRTAKGNPYKWRGECQCGWACLSWSWSRALEAARYDRYIEENGPPVGGALVMALAHTGLLPEDSDGIYPKVGAS